MGQGVALCPLWAFLDRVAVDAFSAKPDLKDDYVPSAGEWGEVKVNLLYWPGLAYPRAGLYRVSVPVGCPVVNVRKRVEGFARKEGHVPRARHASKWLAVYFQCHIIITTIGPNVSINTSVWPKALLQASAVSRASTSPCGRALELIP